MSTKGNIKSCLDDWCKEKNQCFCEHQRKWAKIYLMPISILFGEERKKCTGRLIRGEYDNAKSR